jgi:sodium-dependent dicarboxylate transporter 2/3/5
MDKIQLIFFFISGFLVSRLIIKVKLPQRIVYWFIGKKHLSISKILFYLIAISAFLSFFIPNAITVLTLLPLLELLRRSYEESNGSSRRIATMLALATIYGANIGGMGSVTATPANGILVTYAVLESVPGTRDISFASWLVWGIPLVAIFVCVAWAVLVTIMRPWKLKAAGMRLPFHSTDVYHPFQKTTVWITIFYFISSFILSLLLMHFSGHIKTILAITGIITLLFVLFLFFLPMKGSDPHTPGQVLLSVADCYNELPMKGFLFVGISIVLAGLLYALNVHEVFPKWVQVIKPAHTSTLALFFTVAAATSFSTEILSNTAVQLSFFIMALPLAETLGVSGLAILIIITLSCTCAFMSPIATGVNGLAFGGVKDVSFRRMLLVGFFMNIVGALLISAWTLLVISPLYGLN